MVRAQLGQIAVHDSGPGLEAQDILQAFERYYHAATRPEGDRGVPSVVVGRALRPDESSSGRRPSRSGTDRTSRQWSGRARIVAAPRGVVHNFFTCFRADGRTVAARAHS